MIKINDSIIDVKYFPDGTQCLLDVDTKKIMGDSLVAGIMWRYESDEELVTLIYLVNHLRANGCEIIDLDLMYLPNARMDRCHDVTKEVFTLKYFCNIINSLHFNAVCILDVHSKQGYELLNRCTAYSPYNVLSVVIKSIGSNVVLYFPDKGSKGRYANMFPYLQTCYGEKQRDWITGEITGLDIITDGVDLKDKTILMVDDICSYGGTLYYSALKLKELGVGKIYSYATHTENSILDKEKGKLIHLLEDGTVECLFTTNSLYSRKHDKIKVIGVSVNEAL